MEENNRTPISHFKHGLYEWNPKYQKKKKKSIIHNFC